jgi:hypothetical protein
MRCENCGYENDPSAYLCNLCGRLLRYDEKKQNNNHHNHNPRVVKEDGNGLYYCENHVTQLAYWRCRKCLKLLCRDCVDLIYHGKPTEICKNCRERCERV